jgi:hypothetical protein
MSLLSAPNEADADPTNENPRIPGVGARCRHRRPGESVLAAQHSDWRMPRSTNARFTRFIYHPLPVQVAAMRLAELRGVVVGSFRYVPQVTRDEHAISRADTAADD